MIIKPATLKDLPEIVAIYNENIPSRTVTADTAEINVGSRLNWFHQHKENRPLWIMENNGEVAGWLSLQDF